MAEPKSTLVDVISYLKTTGPVGAFEIQGTPTPTSEMKNLSAEDRIELRRSLDIVKGL